MRGQIEQALPLLIAQLSVMPKTDACLDFLEASDLLDLQRLGTQGGRLRFNIAQRGREGEGERVVGDPQGRLREGLFIAASR